MNASGFYISCWENLSQLVAIAVGFNIWCLALFRSSNLGRTVRSRHFYQPAVPTLVNRPIL